MHTNKHGLSRHIPEAVRRQVRQECGFGCVICGLAVAQYEHIDPQFSEAGVHDPRSIALLCASCHDKVTRGIWSKQKVMDARTTPITFSRGCAKDAFDFRHPIELVFGSNRFCNVRTIARRRSGESWFDISPPEDIGAPPSINAKFFGPSGEPELVIVENEWRVATSNWDVLVEGPRLSVRNNQKDEMLRWKVSPPHTLEIERLHMKLGEVGISITPGKGVTLYRGEATMQMENCRMKNVNVVFDLP